MNKDKENGDEMQVNVNQENMTFANKADGMESIITKTENGFTVALWDTDAAEQLPTSMMFPESALHVAIATAKIWAGV